MVAFPLRDLADPDVARGLPRPRPSALPRGGDARLLGSRSMLAILVEAVGGVTLGKERPASAGLPFLVSEAS